MPSLLVVALTALTLAYVGVQLAIAARRAVERRERVLALLRGLRPRHVWPAPVVLTAIVAAFFVLALVPGLSWGWWTAIGGEGNIVFGSTAETDGTILEVLVPVAFGLLLLPALPLLVESEERRFRLGAETWSTRRRALRGLQFGLIHVLVGIPIAAGLALSLAGWWLTWVYVRTFRRTGRRAAALDESTRAHLGYDLVVVGIVVVSVLAGCGPADPTATVTVRVDGVEAAGVIPERIACSGDNAAPTLRWTGGPSGSAGWAVVVEDPDASTGTFTHWVVTGVPASARSLDGAALPDGAVVSKGTSGQSSWVGPCPPGGETHRFRFRVHALSAALVLTPETTVTEARRRIEEATLDAGQLEARFTGT